MPKTKKKTPISTTPRVPISVYEKIKEHAKDHGCTMAHSWETIVTLGIQRSDEFEKILSGGGS